MTTNLQRAKAIIDASMGGTASGQQLQNIAAACAAYAPYNFTPADPEKPTAEEKAECFIKTQRQWMHSWLEAVGENEAKETAQAAIAIAKAAQRANLP